MTTPVEDYIARLKDMTPEERAWAKIRLNSEYTAFRPAIVKFYPVNARAS